MHYHHLNLFQQNLFIQQVNININVYPTIQTKLQDLDVTFSEFKTACEFLENAEIKDKAVKVLASYKNILENKKDFRAACQHSRSTNHSLKPRTLLNLSLLETGLVLFSTFLDNSNKFDHDKKIAKSLYKNIQELYDSCFGRELNKRFWDDLKLFEFLLKEGIASSWNQSRKQRLEFSEQELELFFTQNRNFILNSIRNEKEFVDPLNDEELSSIYEMYKKIKNFNVEFEDPKLITVKE